MAISNCSVIQNIMFLPINEVDKLYYGKKYSALGWAQLPIDNFYTKQLKDLVNIFNHRNVLYICKMAQ